MTKNDGQAAGGYIVEFVAIGKSVKATAFDPASLREVSVIGSRSASQKQLAELAVRKLEYMIEKNATSE